MRELAILLMLFIPAFASAQLDMITCSTPSKSFVVQLSYSFEGSYSDIQNSPGKIPFSAVAKFTKVDGRSADQQVDLQGEAMGTTKGPSIDLSNEDGTAIQIAAPASDFPSVMTIRGKDMTVICL